MTTFKSISSVLALTALAACGAESGPGRKSSSISPIQSQVSVETQAESGLSLELAFITHLDANLPEQDIFIEREANSNDVFRPTKGDNNMQATLYKSARSIKHNPFDPKAIGPHAKGEPIGMNLGQWLAQKGSGTYTCQEGVAELDMSFAGLVPEGVYTIWHAFMALPPTDPFSGTLDLPLGARDGSESVFKAEADGSAKFVRSFSPCLALSNEWTTSMLALNYHSDGKTYKADPGDFGSKSHIPLFVMLPKAQESSDAQVAQR
jgi:hypothetical protein